MRIQSVLGPFGLDATGIIAGSLDGPTGLQDDWHIFVAEQCDFYAITDGLPQYQFCRLTERSSHDYG